MTAPQEKPKKPGLLDRLRAMRSKQRQRAANRAYAARGGDGPDDARRDTGATNTSMGGGGEAGS
jgi:hypothetical protein